jgi:hypothetical protein
VGGTARGGVHGAAHRAVTLPLSHLFDLDELVDNYICGILGRAWFESRVLSFGLSENSNSGLPHRKRYYYGVMFRNPLKNLGVIPGKLAIAGATRNPGNQKLWIPLSRVRRWGVREIILRTLVPGHFGEA